MSTVEVGHEARRQGQSAAADVVTPTVPGSATSWHQFGRSARHAGFDLEPVADRPEVQWCAPDVWLDLVSLIDTEPVPELAGLHSTFGLVRMLIRLRKYAGKQGDRAFVSSRRLAEDIRYSYAHVHKLRAAARDAGLLLRLSHGSRRGAVDVLACPGGTEGAKRLIDRLQERNSAHFTRANDGPRDRIARRRIRPQRREVSERHRDQARRLLVLHPSLAGQIAHVLGKTNDVETGAVEVVAWILFRGGTRLKMVDPPAYIMGSVRKDRNGSLTSKWPQPSPQPGAAPARPVLSVSPDDSAWAASKKILESHPELAGRIAAAVDGKVGDGRVGALACIGEVVRRKPKDARVTNWPGYVMSAIRKDRDAFAKRWFGAQGHNQDRLVQVLAQIGRPLRE